MQRVSRLKFIILATIACAILFCIAAFSVSLAMWDTDGDTAVEVSGESGLFYVEYPQYVTESGVAIPALDANRYYLQVQKAGGVSDYYRMKDNLAPSNPNNTEKMLENVYIQANTVLDLFKGTTKIGFKSRKDSSADEFLYTDNAATAQVTKTGYYSFYYEFNEQWAYAAVHVSYKSSGSAGSTSTVVPSRDLSKRSCKVLFNDGTAIVFDETGHDWGEALTKDLNFHIWQEGGAGTSWPGIQMNQDADNATNTIELACKPSDISGIIISCGNSGQNANNYQTISRTGDGANFFNDKFKNGLSANYTYTFDLSEMHDYGNDLTVTEFPKIGVSAKKPATTSTGSGTATTTITAAKPTTTGATEFNVSEQKSNTKVETVRVMDAKMNETASGYEYHNYICVSRPNTDDSADDNSMAIIEFEIKGKGATTDLTNIPVSAIKLTRRDTDEDGNPLDGYIDPAPRVYNYDLTNPVYLSDIGHSVLHDKASSDFSQMHNGLNTTHMQSHYGDGMYVILFFADKKQQYFALDLTIETTEYAEFTLTAKVNNTNMWDRYEEGWGEEWGYYLGGLINEVWLWNPKKTTKFEIDSGAVVFNKTKEETYLTNHSIEDLNSDANTEFNYKIKDYSNGGTVKDEDGNPMYARYCKEYVDITLTINLVANSKVKLCMLDGSGQRGDIGNADESKRIMRPTIYLLPKKITAFPGDLFASANNYDDDLNFIVPKSGEYSLRFVGYINDYVGKWIKKSDSSLKLTKPSDDEADQYVTIPEYNFVIDELYISRAKVVGEMITVKFDANGGKFDADAVTEQLVRFGNLVKFPEEDDEAPKAPKVSQITPPEGKQFAGWYYKKTIGGTETIIDYDGDPVLEDMTLYVKWIGNEYEVTFNANEPAGKTATWSGSTKLKTDTSGTLVGKTLPTLSIDGYAFDGWYLEQTNPATQVGTTTVFNGDTTVYAKWTQLFTVTFHNNYPDTETDTSFSTQPNVRDGATISEPAGTPTRTGYTFNGKWYKEPACTTEWNFATDTVSATAKDLYAGWNIKNFTVTFEIDGVAGTGDYAAQTVQEGKAATKPADPTKDYYTFDGWYNGASKWDFDANEVTGNVKLVAKYTAITYTVEYLGGGTTTNPTSITIANFGAGTTIVLSKPTPPAGHSFVEWQQDGSKVENITVAMLNKTATNKITFTAKYDPFMYSIVFDLNGADGDVPTHDDVEYGDKLTKPATDPSRGEHYSFAGWYVKNANGTLAATAWNFNSDTVGTSSDTAGKTITLAAKWNGVDGIYADGVFVKTWAEDGADTKIKFENIRLTAGAKLTFWKGGEQCKTNVYVRGGLSNNEITGTSYSNITVNTSGYYNIYYNSDNSSQNGLWITYDGAYVAPDLKDGDGLYNNSAATGDPIAVLVEHLEGANEVMAMSVEIGVTTTVTFKYGGAIVKVKQKDSCPTGTFNADGTVTLDAGTYDFYLRYTDMMLWINGTAAEYEIEYILPEGATNNAANPTKYAIVNGTKALGNPTMPADKTFLGWKLTNASGIDVEEITPTNIDTLSNGTRTITLCADWDYLYTVTFHYNYTGAPNGGVYDTITVQNRYTITDDDMPDDPSRDGYSFEGWYKEATCSNAWTASDTVSGNITLYADWKESVVTTYTITFNVNTANGGSGSNTVYSGKKAGDTITVPDDPDPSSDLYAFDGWYNKATGGTKYNTIPTTVSGNATYYAQYKAVKYRIVLDVSSWPEWLSSGSYSYYIHAYGGTGVGTVTGDWSTERPAMTSMGNNKYFYDLTATGITNIIFARNKANDRNTEYMRYEVSVSGLALGNTYTYTATRDNVGFDGYQKVNLKFGSDSAMIFIKGVAGINYWNCSPESGGLKALSSVDNTLTAGGYGGINMQYTNNETEWWNQTANIWWTYSANSVTQYDTNCWGVHYYTIAIDTKDTGDDKALTKSY